VFNCYKFNKSHLTEYMSGWRDGVEGGGEVNVSVYQTLKACDIA